MKTKIIDLQLTNNTFHGFILDWCYPGVYCLGNSDDGKYVPFKYSEGTEEV